MFYIERFQRFLSRILVSVVLSPPVPTKRKKGSKQQEKARNFAKDSSRASPCSLPRFRRMLSSSVIKHGTACLLKRSSCSRGSRHSSCLCGRFIQHEGRQLQHQQRQLQHQKRMTSASATAGNSGAREAVADRLKSISNHSWVEKLNPDPETDAYAPNKTSRRVKSGHFVRVQPTPLKRPALIIHSRKVLEDIGLHEGDESSETFVRFFSGDSDAIPGMKTWATPYALSIMGQKHTSNCPFGTGLSLIHI